MQWSNDGGRERLFEIEAQIRAECNAPMKRVVNVLVQGCHGYNDFVRGCINLHLSAKGICDTDFAIRHPVRQILKYKGIEEGDDPIQAEHTYRLGGKSLAPYFKDGTFYFRCNWIYRGLETADCLHQFQTFYELDNEYADKFERFYESFIGKESYNIIHCRFADTFLGNDKLPPQTEKMLDAMSSVVENGTVLITSSPAFTNVCKKGFSGLKTTGFSNQHFGQIKDVDTLFETFAEMLLFTRAVKCDAFSVFSWGSSGFSLWPCKIFGVPFAVQRV